MDWILYWNVADTILMELVKWWRVNKPFMLNILFLEFVYVYLLVMHANFERPTDHICIVYTILYAITTVIRCIQFNFDLESMYAVEPLHPFMGFPFLWFEEKLFGFLFLYKLIFCWIFSFRLNRTCTPTNNFPALNTHLRRTRNWIDAKEKKENECKKCCSR